MCHTVVLSPVHAVSHTYFFVYTASPIVTKDNMAYAKPTIRASAEDVHQYTYISFPVFPVPQLHDVAQPYATPEPSCGK